MDIKWKNNTLICYKYFFSDFYFSKKLPLNLASGMLCNRTHSIRNHDPWEQLCWIQTASFKSRKNARSRHLFCIPGLWAEPFWGGWMAFTTPSLQTLQRELPRASGCIVRSEYPALCIARRPKQLVHLGFHHSGHAWACPHSPAPWNGADFFPVAPILSLLPSTRNLSLLKTVPPPASWEAA